MKHKDLTLVEATWAPIARQIRAKSMAVKQAVYEGLNPSQKALYLVEILRGHSAHGVRHMLGVLEPALAQPASWPAIRGGFAFFGAQRMLDLLPAIEALHLAPEAESAAVDALLPDALDEALHLVAAYIRTHPTEFSLKEA